MAKLDAFKQITRKNKALVIAVFFFLSAAGNILAFDYLHDSPSPWRGTEALMLRFESLGSDSYSIQCRYRFQQESEFETDALIAFAPGHYQLELHPPKHAELLEYYFEVYKNGELHATVPEESPSYYPLRVFKKKHSIEYFSVVRPRLDQVHNYSKDMLFVIKQNFPKYATIDAAFLNDDEPLQVLAKSSSVINFKNSFPIRRGKNKLSINGKYASGEPFTKHYYFSTDRRKSYDSLRYKGSANFDHLVYGTNKESSITHDTVELAYTAQADIESPFFNAKILGLFDSRESKHTQAYNRFSTTVVSPKQYWKVSAGDTNVAYSPLTLNGRRARGVAAELDLLSLFPIKSRLTFNMLSGVTNRAVSVSSGNVSVGTYEQLISAWQLKYHGFTTKTSVQFVHARDLSESLSSENAGTTKPEENFLLSAAFQKRFSPLSYVNTEFSGSIHYSDTTVPTIDISELEEELPQYVQDISDKYIPIKSSLSTGAASQTEVQFPLFSKHSIFNISYDYVLPTYANIINSGINTDRSEIKIKHSQKLKNKKWMINSQVQLKNDNIIFSENETQYSRSYKVNSIYQTKYLGSMNASYLSTNRSNAFSSVATGNVDLNNRLNFIMLGFSGIPLNNVNNDSYLNVNYSISEFNDLESKSNNSNTNSLGLSVSTKYNDSRLLLGFNQSVLDAVTGGTTNYISLSSKLSKKILIYDVHAGIKAVYGKNNHDDDNYKVNTKKMTYSAGLSYKKKETKYFKESKLYGSLEYVAATDYLDSSDRSSNYYELFTRFKVDNRF